jgi:Ca-activated chloride channel family protein
MRLHLAGAGAVVAAALLVVGVGGSWAGYRQFAGPDCDGEITLTVAAAPELASAVQQAATRWIAGGAAVSGRCVRVGVSSVSPVTMAAALAERHGVTLTGLGPPSGGVVVPHVWIPDSSTWLLRLKSEAPGFLPTDGRPVAQSPVVVAMPEPLAQPLGWPDRKLSWSDLLRQITTNDGLRTGIVDPTRDAAGLAGLLALGAAAGPGESGRTSAAGALRALATGRSALRADLLEKFPRSTDAADIAGSLSAAPLSEEGVIAYNAKNPPVSLAALYLDPVPPSLDYPYAVLPEADATLQAAAEGLRGALGTAEFKNALAAAGLRGPDGTVGAGFAAPVGAPPAGATAPPAASTPAGGGAGGAASIISQALGSWAAITLPGRALAVFDISGSMAEPVNSAGGASRAQVTRAAARQGLTLFEDDWAVGVWVFSSKLSGSQDWREIVPISPLSARRGDLLKSIDGIVPKKGSATGLYDTALAAYRTVRAGWEPGRVNSVLLFTDGKNQDKEGLTQAQLVAQLKKAADPLRPVRMIIIGIGNDVDPKELKAITDATGGGVFTTEDPTKIGEIFLEAIASRTGTAR